MLRIYFILLSILCSSFLYSQDRVVNDVFVPITKYIEEGKADKLSVWFPSSIEIVVLGERSNCSKVHAVEILRNFFESNPPKSVDLRHRGDSYPLKYAIGVLETSLTTYKLTLLIKVSESGNYIQQIIIEDM